MGRNYSYNRADYKEKQKKKATEAWKKRLIDFKYKRETRICARADCKNGFDISACDPKRYCSQSCSAKVTNVAKGKRSEETKQKIANSLVGRPNPHKGEIKVPRIEKTCRYTKCNRCFLTERWRTKRYCSRGCLIRDVGSRPTSPKASKGKNGIQKDISPTINFYSRWEANMARLYNHLHVAWEYAPRSFDIGGQMYTPDFYLPKTDTYVEVKNFWWKYSKDRDEKFRKTHPKVRLDVILKDEYLKLEKQYAHHIPKWEYKNSKFLPQ